MIRHGGECPAGAVGTRPFRESRQPDMIERARAILKAVFGYDRFISLQRQVIEQVLQRRDTLAVMPTGGGKSVCYQIPALLFEGPVIVVSPLISLMKDQVDQLRQLDIPTAILNSSLSDQDYRANVARIRQNQARLVYLAPETLLKPAVLDLLAAARVSLVAIDEAHCISEWGPDFRPEYRRLAELRPLFGAAVWLALTATATPRVRTDIAACLGLDQSAVLVAGFNRENLFIRVLAKYRAFDQALEFIRRFPGDSGIVYCFTRKQVDHLSAALQAQGLAAAAYHAGLSDEERERTQSRFVRDEIRIVVATIAFGMGIDKSNVRFVLHFDLPKSLESYYQEIGRAGRDGLRAECLLLYSPFDRIKADHFIDLMEDPQHRRAAGLQLNAMVRFAEAQGCRRVPLLGYFGESFAAEQCGGMCDNCAAGERPKIDLTVAAQKYLSCVKRTGERFGSAHIIDVLRGSRNRKVLENGHDRLSTYGIGGDYSSEQWRYLANQFLHQGLLAQDQQFGGLSLTARAWEVLRGRENFSGYPLPETKSELESGADASAGPENLRRDLFERLRTRRMALAQAENVPPDVIFSDRTLADMVARLPQDDQELLRIHGVGTVKLTRYGGLFSEIIRQYCIEHPEAKPAASALNTASGYTSQGLKKRSREVGEAFNEGRSIADLTRQYAVRTDTIVDHLERYQQGGSPLRLNGLESALEVPQSLRDRALQAFRELGCERLRPIHEALEGAVDYEQLKILRMIHGVPRESRARAPIGTGGAPAALPRTLICLANSRKYSGRCVAGKEWLNDAVGGWMRPVSRAPTGELTPAELTLADGSSPKLLDLVTIPLAEPGPPKQPYQSENRFLGVGAWVRTGTLPRDRVATLRDPVETLWINGHHSFTGINDRIPLPLIEKEIRSSLCFVPVERAVIEVRPGSKGLKKVWAGFRFCATSYRLSVTDPEIESRYLARDPGEYPLTEAEVYVTVSISEPFQGFCYKLAAAILTGP